MSKWIGMKGEQERVIINTEKVVYLASNSLGNVEIHFDNGNVKTFRADYKKTLEELEKILRKAEQNDICDY